MINISELLYSLCENNEVYNPDCELIESGILDSFAIMELFSMLEDEGIIIYPTRIDKSLLKTPAGIIKLVEDYLEKQGK